MPINIDQLIADITAVSTEVVTHDVTTLQGFSERQVKAIAQQAAYVAKGIAAGEISEETRGFFLAGLEDMALNYAKTLHGLNSIVIEKVWNGVVSVIWKAISSATGLVFPTHFSG